MAMYLRNNSVRNLCKEYIPKQNPAYNKPSRMALRCLPVYVYSDTCFFILFYLLSYLFIYFYLFIHTERNT